MSKPPKLTEIQTLTLEQILENTESLIDELNDMISTQKGVMDALPSIVEYSAAINSHVKKLQKEFRLKNE